MELENYQKEENLISIVWANVFSLLMLIPSILIFVLPYYFIWSNTSLGIPIVNDLINAIIDGDIFVALKLFTFFLAFLAIIILGIILHELIHGIFFAKYAKNGFSSIKFGVIWKKLMPYCNCKEPLTVRHYIIAAIMPTIILGIIPSIISILIGNVWVLLFGIIFIVSGAGDILIIHSLRNEKKDDLVIDHPSEPGCYIFRKII